MSRIKPQIPIRTEPRVKPMFQFITKGSKVYKLVRGRVALVYNSRREAMRDSDYRGAFKASLNE